MQDSVRENTVSHSVDPLSALRCTAILFVFILHTLIYSKENGYSVSGGWEVILVTPAWAGVWILFMLSGYLAGKGFFSNRYPYSPKGIIRYYLTRFVKTFLPVWIFLVICLVFICPSFVTDHPESVIQMFTFMYNGEPSEYGLGVLWYMSTIFWLYLLAPFMCIIVDRIDRVLKHRGVVWSVLLLLTLFSGLVVRLIQLRLGYNWHDVTYTFFGSNIDLFLSGIILNKVVESTNRVLSPSKLKAVQFYSVSILILLFLTNCYYYAYDYFRLYAYYYPTLWAAFVVLFVIGFNQSSKVRKSPPLSDALKHSGDAVQYFANISFEFYLWHCVVLSNISPYFGNLSPLIGHLALLLSAFVISFVVSLVFHRVMGPVTSFCMKGVRKVFG